MHKYSINAMRWLKTVNKILLRLPLLLGSLLVCGYTVAEQSITVISSSNSPAYITTVSTIKQRLAENKQADDYVISELFHDELMAGDATIDSNTSLVITVGSAAAEYIVEQKIPAPVIFSFITCSAFEVLQAKIPAAQQYTAIFIDQPLGRLMTLSQLIAQKAELKLGVLSQAQSAELNNDKTDIEGISISQLALALDKNPIKQIEPLIKNNDMLIVRPSSSLFNRLVAKLVLQLGMRYKTPVIGFSESYSKAGALASLYAGPENIGLDVADTIAGWLLQPATVFPEPAAGKYFSLAINPRVAKKHGLQLDNDALTVALKLREGG